ncbi:hypothetical protein DGWBC_0444 [Dehalogenimonas sp. WBC-2]|nr:hypothetical protein DGWBC_0444 [Dehalogenimonas sp. WBC-2]
MELLHREDMLEMLKRPESPAVTIYLPTHRTGDTEADPIRFRHVLDEAENRLVETGVRAPVARKMLAPGRNLLPDGLFWQHQEEGMVCFITPSSFRYYTLPFTVPETVVVADDYHIRPLLPLLENDGIYYLLSLSLNNTSLFQARRLVSREIPLPEELRNMVDANQHDDSEKSLQYHTTGPGPAIFHGQSDPDNFNKAHITHFLQKLSRELEKILATERAPLVVAGVENIRTMFRGECAYAHILEEGIEGNPERMTPEKLHAAAWETVSQYFGRQREQVLSQYLNASGPERSVKGLESVLFAAEDGRVAALFLTETLEARGTIDRMQRKIEIDPNPVSDNTDLVEYSVRQTLMTGGDVYVLTPEELPDAAEISAMLRY